MRLGEALLVGACARFDRFVLNHFIRRAPTTPPPGLGPRLERAREFYADPRFIAEPDTFYAPPHELRAEGAVRVVGLPGGELVRLEYETDFEAVFPEAREDPLDACNRRGTALWWRHAEHGRPTMICVHGYGGGQTWL